MVRRMDVDTEQTIDGIAVLLQRIAEESDPRVDDQHIQRPTVTHQLCYRIPVGAVGLHRNTSGFSGELRGGVWRAGVAENHRRALGSKTPDYSRPNTTTPAQNQYRSLL